MIIQQLCVPQAFDEETIEENVAFVLENVFKTQIGAYKESDVQTRRVFCVERSPF
jgi:hypothetical protein